jgi:hypothetical protein
MASASLRGTGALKDSVQGAQRQAGGLGVFALAGEAGGKGLAHLKVKRRSHWCWPHHLGVATPLP